MGIEIYVVLFVEYLGWFNWVWECVVEEIV